MNDKKNKISFKNAFLSSSWIYSHLKNPEKNFSIQYKKFNQPTS